MRPAWLLAATLARLRTRKLLRYILLRYMILAGALA